MAIASTTFRRAARAEPARNLRRIGYRLLVVVYALLFSELFVRLFAPVPIMPRYVTGAPYGVRVGMPNMDFWQSTPETHARIRTNSRGIRADQEFTYAKAPDVCRVLLFGDSYFVGYEVNLEDSFAYRLDERLRAAGHHCQVINLAVSGFGTAEMLVTLREEGLKYQPDVVVFSSNVSDLDDNVRSSLYTLDSTGRLLPQSATFLPGIRVSDQLSKLFVYRWLAENSQLYSAFRERSALQIKDLLLRLRSTQAPTAVVANSPATAPVAPGTSLPERLNLALLEEAKRVAESKGAHFMVLEIPANKTRTEFERMLPEYPPEIVRNLNLISPLSVFQAAADPSKKLYFEKGHGHLTPLGNRLLADYFESQLEETHWLH